MQQISSLSFSLSPSTPFLYEYIISSFLSSMKRHLCFLFTSPQNFFALKLSDILFHPLHLFSFSPPLCHHFYFFHISSDLFCKRHYVCCLALMDKTTNSSILLFVSLPYLPNLTHSFRVFSEHIHSSTLSICLFWTVLHSTTLPR